MSSPSPDARTVGARVEELLAEFGRVADPEVCGLAEELVRTLVEFYGSGLARVVEVLSTVDDSGAAVKALGADELVGGLLVLHDLHPDDTAARVAAALAEVRPYLGSHAGDVELLGVSDQVVRLRLAGSCHGCPSSTVTVKLAIEAAIDRLAPEITRVEVEGVVPDVPAAGTGPGDRPLLPLCPVSGTPEPSAPRAAS